MTVKYITYLCQQCGAEDTDKLFENEPVAPIINCWKCHAGFQLEIPQMLRGNKGMTPQPNAA